VCGGEGRRGSRFGMMSSIVLSVFPSFSGGSVHSCREGCLFCVMVPRVRVVQMDFPFVQRVYRARVPGCFSFGRFRGCSFHSWCSGCLLWISISVSDVRCWCR